MVSLFLEIPPTFWLSALFIALLSLWGDKVELSPKIRLIAQFLAALFIVHSAILDAPIAIIIFLTIFIVGTANFYNFMDGIDGIAAVTGIVGFGLLVYFIILNDSDTYLAILSLSIVLACLGFLPFNFPKARVFMGDVGSILLGFLFACIVILISNDFLDLITLAAFIFPFYADELATMIVRLKDGESLLRPHRRHIYQLLANELEVPHWKVTIGYGVLQLTVGLTVLWGRSYGMAIVLLLLALYFALFLLAGYLVRKKVVELA
ncbi:MAG: UDP-N-acetylmuramyl pentapeptide phosphotransferase, partial [Nitrospinae bacterium]|nr:UDP-N-acetylmuramyl pentapeptide phosphotransferase [Nitrospinota bacterium]